MLTFGSFLFTLSSISCRKKIFLLGLLTIGAAEARAQSISAGTISLGGSIGYNQFSGNSNTVYSGNSGLNYNFSNDIKGHYL